MGTQSKVNYIEMRISCFQALFGLGETETMVNLGTEEVMVTKPLKLLTNCRVLVWCGYSVDHSFQWHSHEMDSCWLGNFFNLHIFVVFPFHSF